MRKDHNIFYLALYVGSAVGMVGSGIAVFLYQMLGSHTDLLNFLFGLFVLFFFVFLIVNIASFIKILMILYKDKKLIKTSMIMKNRWIKKQPASLKTCTLPSEKSMILYLCVSTVHTIGKCRFSSLSIVLF